ncbi:MAG: hypothetical protein IJC25_06450, partial [Clostridia bacterium]|nr:hypothetical protein [Clostridia bacterium]
MSVPHLFTSPKDLSDIRMRLERHSWYRDAFEHIRAECDKMLRLGFSVPKTSGFVFYVSCKRDNTPLIFNPYDPHNHVCPVCGMNYQDEPFHRAWQCSYHHWLSQMAIHLGICYAVTQKEDYAAAVRKMLLDYAQYYPTYPNKDNELGTTRVFQSTYMESVWLSYLCCAYDLVNAAPC